MDDSNFVYNNSEKKPIGELFFSVPENGVCVKVSALSKFWTHSMPHTKYKVLPISNGKIEENSALDEWFMVARKFNEEMLWLLSLEHHRFWSYMIFDNGCIASITSFLQDAIPFYTPLATLTNNDQVLQLYSAIHNSVIKVICRLLTNRESETEWITKPHLAELLYSKFLISIPMLFDIIIAYGRSNGALLTRLFKTIFTIESKYKEDLAHSLEFTKKAFDIIQATINANTNETSFDDLALYTLDCVSSISILFETYPEAIEMGLSMKFEQIITNFYDSTLPQLYKQIYIVNAKAQSLEYLLQARIELLETFRSMSNFYLEKLLTNPTDRILPAENLLSMLQEALADHIFVVDYQRTYPVLNDIDILNQACKDLDQFKIDYIIEAYTSETKSELKTHSNVAETSDAENHTPNLQPEHIEPSTSANVDRRIQSVLDVLPDLKANFVEKLLSRYDTAEQAIAAVLEGNLPPDLEEMQNMHLLYEDDDGAGPSNILNEYKRNGQQAIIVKVGKGLPNQPNNVNDLLDDKTHINEMRKKYELLGLVSEDEYDDEYDDSYEAMAESESKARSALRKTGANNYVADEESDEESDVDDNGDSSNRDRSKDFCEDPEAIRARMAQNRASKYAARNISKPPRTTDVVGKPKGQGQEHSTVRSRQVKDAHKSTRANHNRRQGASWKRNRGMIPS